MQTILILILYVNIVGFFFVPIYSVRLIYILSIIDGFLFLFQIAVIKASLQLKWTKRSLLTKAMIFHIT